VKLTLLYFNYLSKSNFYLLIPILKDKFYLYIHYLQRAKHVVDFLNEFKFNFHHPVNIITLRFQIEINSLIKCFIFNLLCEEYLNNLINANMLTIRLIIFQ
jgi:hypothetical protein